MEHIAAFARLTGDELDNYLLAGWAHSVWTGKVEHAVNLCLYPDPPPLEAPDVDFPVEELEHRRPGTTESLALVAKHAPAILATVSDETIRKHGKRWFETLTDAAAYQRRHRELSTAGAVLAGRASRVRNSLVHGNPADERVVATVRGISRYRAHLALDIALQAVADGVAMLEVLDRRRRLAAVRAAALTQGVSLADQWATPQ